MFFAVAHRDGVIVQRAGHAHAANFAADYHIAAAVFYFCLHHACARQVGEHIFAVTVGHTGIFITVRAEHCNGVALCAACVLQPKAGKIAYHTGHAGGAAAACIHNGGRAFFFFGAEVPALCAGVKHRRAVCPQRDGVTVSVKMPRKALDGRPIVRQHNVVRKDVTIPNRVRKPVFILVVQLGQFLGAADAVYKVYFLVAVLLALAHLALLALAQVHHGVGQNAAFVNFCHIKSRRFMAYLVHAKAAVCGKVKIVGALQPGTGGRHQAAETFLLDTV